MPSAEPASEGSAVFFSGVLPFLGGQGGLHAEVGGWRKYGSGCFLSPEDYLVLTSLQPLDWPEHVALVRDVPKEDVTHACIARSQQHLLRAQLCQEEGHSWPLAHAAQQLPGRFLTFHV